MADLQENKTCSGERTPTNSRPIPPPRSSTKKADKMDSDSMTDSDLSDWETRRFGHTNITSPPLIPRQSAENISPSSSPNKRTYPPLFDSGLDSTNFSSELFPKKRHTDHFKWTPDKENRFHGNWNNSVSSHDSAIGGSLFSAFESVLTDSSSSFESQINSEESASNLSSPAHSVYGRYQKTQDEKSANAENETEMLVLHRLPGENLGMILGIEGGKSKESVSGVYVKTVTIGGAAYRATGGTKGIEVGDRILQINGTDINTLTHDECLSVLREMPLRVILKVLRNQNKKTPSVTSPAHSIRSQRSYDSSRCGMTSEYSESSSYSESEDDGNTDGKCDGFDLIRVEVDKNPNESLGLSIVPSYGSTRQFYQIKRILPSGAAARSQQLKVGDRLVSCNGISLRNVSQNWCLTTLKSEGNNGDIELQVYRQSEKESQLEISLRVSNRAGIAGGNDSTVTLRSPHADRHFFSEVPNSDSDNEVILNKFQFIENHNNHFGQTLNESKNHKTPLRESKKERETRNRIVSSEQEGDTDPEIAAITGKKDKSKMESEGGGSYIPPPVEFSAFGPAVPPPKEFSEGQSPIFDQTRNDGMPVTNIDEILNSYPHTGIVSSGPMDSSDQNSNSFKSPIKSKGTGSYDNDSYDQRLNSDEEEIDSLDNSMEINGEANNSVHIGAPEEFANQEYIEVSESYLAKEDQDEQISKSESSQQECAVNSFSNGGVGDEYVDKFPRSQDVSGSININHSKLSGDINEQSPEEIVVPVKIQRRNLESTPVSVSSENKVSSGDVDEDVIVPSVIKRENLSHSSVEVKKPNTETEVEDKVIPTPRPRPQPRTNRTVKSGSEARQMDENSISHPKYPPPVQTETEVVGVEEEVMVSVVRPKVDAGKVMEEKLHPGIQEESIVPTEVKRAESAWNPAKMVVITNMWAKSAAENKEKEEIQDNGGKVGAGIKDLLGLVSKAGKKEEAEESEEDDKDEEEDTSPAAIEEVVVDIKTIDSIDNTQVQEVETPKQVTMVSVSNDMIHVPDNRNQQSSESASDQTGNEVVKEQENIEQNKSEIITGDGVVTVSVKSEEPPEITPEQIVKDVEIPDLSAKVEVTPELEVKPDNSAIIAVEPSIQQDEVRKENKTLINLSHKPETINVDKSPQNVAEKVSPRGEESKLPEEEDNSNVPEKSPVTSPRQYKSFVSVTKPQSILGTVKSQNASSGLKPLSSIKPLTVSAKTFSLGKPVKYATTISTNSGKPSLLSTIHGSATSAKNTRSEDEPFLVSVLKGILGLGMKVSVTPEGAVQVTEIQQSGPIAKDGNIRVGDYILAINSTEMTGLTDSKVQQILRLLPRGLAKIMVSTKAPTSDNPDLAESSGMPSKADDKKPPAREEPKTQSRISLPSPVIHSRKMPLTTSKTTDTSSSTGTASSSSSSGKQNTSDHHGDNRSSRSEESLMSSESKREEKVPEDNHASSKKSPPKVAPKPKHRTTANETTANVPSVKGQGGYVSSAVGRSRSFENKGPAQAEREPAFQKRKADYVSSARKITTHPEKSDSKSDEPIDTVIFASVNHGKDDKVSKASSNRDSQGQPEPRLIPHGHVDYISTSKPKQAPAPPPKPKPVNATSPKSKDIQISPYAYEETTKKVIPTRLNSALSPRGKSGDQGAFKFGASFTKNQSKGKDSMSELDASPVASPRSLSSPTSPKSPFGDVISPVSSPKTLSTPPPQSSTSTTPSEVKKEGVSPVPSPRRKCSNQAPALSPNIQEDDSAQFNVGASPPQSAQDSPSSHVNVGPKLPTQIFDSESPPQPDSFEVKEDRAPSPTPNVVSLHSVDVVKSDAPADDTQIVHESNNDESLPLTSESESLYNTDEGEKKVISENDFNQLLNLEDFADIIVKDAIQRGIDEFKDSEEKNNNSEDCDIVSENNVVSESTNQMSDDLNNEGKMVDDNVLALGVVDVHEQAIQNVKPVMETKSLRAFLEKLDNSNNTANQELPPPDTFSVSDHPVAANIALDMVNDKHVEPLSDTDLSVVNSNNDTSARFGEECNTNITAQNQGEDTRIANSREENRSEATKGNITGDGLIDPSISESNEIKPFASGVCMQASPDLTDSPNLACSNINVVESHDLLGMPTDTQTNLTSKDFIVSDPFSMQGDILHGQQTEEAVGEDFTDNLCKEVNYNVVNSSNITQDENVTVCDSNNEGSLVQDSAKEPAPVHSSHGNVNQTLDEEEQTKGDNSNIEISVQMDASTLKDNNITDSFDDVPVLCDFSKLVSKRQWMLLENGKQEVYVSSAPQSLLDSNILTSTTSSVTSAQKVSVLLDEANSVMDQFGLSEKDRIMVIHLHREDVDNPVGLALKQGKDGNILVSGILPGGLLPVDGKVDVNDHLLLVNGESVKSKQIRDITESFDSLEKDFTLVLSKPASQMSEFDSEGQRSSANIVLEQPESEGESGDDAPPALPESPPPFALSQNDGSKDSQKSANVIDNVGLQQEDSQETNMDNADKSDTDNVKVNSTIDTEVKDTEVNVTDEDVGVEVKENATEVPDVIEEEERIDSTEDVQVKVNDDSTEEPYVIDDVKVDSIVDVEVKVDDIAAEVLNTDRIDSIIDNKVKVTVDTEVKIDDNCNEAPNVTDGGSTDSTTKMEVKVNENSKEDQNVNDDSKTNLTINEEVKVKATEVPEVMDKAKSDATSEAENISKMKVSDVTDSLKNQVNGQSEEPESDDGELKTFEVSMQKGVTGLGFLIEGGIASLKGDQPIIIRRIFKGGPAEKCGQLKVRDEILLVNGVDISQMRHSEAWTHLKFLDDGEVKLLIRRKVEKE